MIGRKVPIAHAIGTLASLVMLAASANAPEIKSTTRLTIIAASGLVEITAPEVLALSHVFAGQFIGAPAESPDPAFARHTVIFDIQTLNGVKHGAYAVQFVFDDSTDESFVYLPGRGDPAYRSNISTMIRDGDEPGIGTDSLAERPRKGVGSDMAHTMGRHSDRSGRWP